MSKISQLRLILEGAHIMGEDPLRDYYSAVAVRESLRIKNFGSRFATIKNAMKNYRVIASIDGDTGHIRLYRPDTQAEIIL